MKLIITESQYELLNEQLAKYIGKGMGKLFKTTPKTIKPISKIVKGGTELMNNFNPNMVDHLIKGEKIGKILDTYIELIQKGEKVKSSEIKNLMTKKIVPEEYFDDLIEKRKNLTKSPLKLIPQLDGTPVYHHTSSDRALQIMDSNELRGTRPSDEYLEIDKKLANTKTKKAISLTRDKNFIPDQSIGASAEEGRVSNLDIIFVLDKDKIKTRYKVEPFNYDSIDHLQKYTTKNKEFEDRVLIDKITSLRDYVKTIIYKGNDPIIKNKIKNFLSKPII